MPLFNDIVPFFINSVRLIIKKNVQVGDNQWFWTRNLDDKPTLLDTYVVGAFKLIQSPSRETIICKRNVFGETAMFCNISCLLNILIFNEEQC